jgi:GR25 family glycosyltransferase involved in LPS biosynthesis
MYIYYINLDERVDRRDEIMSQYNDISGLFQIERITAVKDSVGGIGCTKSHIKALITAKVKQLPYVLIVEDDMQIIDIERFKTTMEQINLYIADPTFKWDVICLGGILSDRYEYERYNDIFIHAKELQTAIAYIVRAGYYDTLLSNFKEALHGLQTTLQYGVYACDQYWKRLQEVDRWFCVYPILIKQRPSYSSIEKQHMNYNRVYNRPIILSDKRSLSIFYDNFIGYEPPSYLFAKLFEVFNVKRVKRYEECDIYLYAYQVQYNNPIKKAAGSKKIHIQMSGEPTYLDLSTFDLNLVSLPTNLEKRVISLPYILQWLFYDHPTKLLDQIRVPLHNTVSQKFCCFIVSNPRCEVRNRFFDRLNAVKRVDSLGRFKNNMGMTCPYGHSSDQFRDFIRQYKFIICFENSDYDNYVTEKLLNPIRAGIIPIYWGNSCSKRWFNSKRFLYLEDTSDAAMDALIRKVIDLDSNNDAYTSVVSEPFIVSNIFDNELSLTNIGKDIKAYLNI